MVLFIRALHATNCNVNTRANIVPVYTDSGVNILHYYQIKYLGKFSLFWYFWEEFLHFDKCFSTFSRILMKDTNYHVDYPVYASFLGKSLFVVFGKSFHGFAKYSPLDLYGRHRLQKSVGSRCTLVQ